MARRRNDRPRVRGPYPHRFGWRVETIDPEAAAGESRCSTDYFGTKEEAEDYRRLVEERFARLYGVTVATALDDYRTFLTETGHKKPSTTESANETNRRLKLFFEETMELRLAKLTEERCEELYRSFAARTYVVGPKRARREKPYSPAHHRHTLAQAKSFLQWCVKPKRWIASSPLAEVKGFGDTNVGKEQLTGDEARIFYKWCVFKAVRGDDAALGLVMCLLMARRQGDVRKRVVRDVDLDGTVLRVGVGSSKKSKTKKGDVAQEIPMKLQPLIRARAAGRSPLEPLFPAADGGFHGPSWLRKAAHRLCAQAGVPYVPPHGLKGTAGTLATIKAGALANEVAAYLDHEQESTSQRHYVADGAARNTVAARSLHVIEGGKQ